VKFNAPALCAACSAFRAPTSAAIVVWAFRPAPASQKGCTTIKTLGGRKVRPHPIPDSRSAVRVTIVIGTVISGFAELSCGSL
jgi:hypothetical protein